MWFLFQCNAVYTL